MTTITLQDFDQLVAASRRNLEELLSEKVAAEMAALAVLTAQLEQSAAERARVDAEQRRAAALAEFEAGALATATATFADMAERIAQLRNMARQAEDLHSAIVAGALELQKEAVATVKMLIEALPEPAPESASEALARAGADGLRYSLPGWLKTLNEKRWLSWPAVDGWTLEQLARGFANERQKQKR